MLKELDQIIIQRMTSDDVNDVTQLEKLCFSDPWTKRCFQDELEHQFSIPLVVKISQKIVGYACLWHVDDQMEIANFAVSPEFRKKGIGRMLMHEMLSEAIKNGCASLMLSVRESNLPALNLYKEFGFVEVGGRKRYYRFPIEDAIIMVKNL